MSAAIWDKLDNFPPIACRLLARVVTPTGGTVAKTAKEIAKDAGMTEMEVSSISWHASWDKLTVDELKRFSLACGVDFTSRDIMRNHSSYLRKSPSFKYLKKSPEWNSVFKPMIVAYVQSRK